MKVFEIPEIELNKFELEDVITTSNGGSNDGFEVGDNQTGGAIRP